MAMSSTWADRSGDVARARRNLRILFWVVLSLLALFAFGFYQVNYAKSDFYRTVEVVRYKITEDARPSRFGYLDVNERSPQNGMTLLIYFARIGDKKAVEYLLAEGADPRLSDNSGRTASVWANLQGHKEIAISLQSAEKDWQYLNQR